MRRSKQLGLALLFGIASFCGLAICSYQWVHLAKTSAQAFERQGADLSTYSPEEMEEFKELIKKLDEK